MSSHRVTRRAALVGMIGSAVLAATTGLGGVASAAPVAPPAAVPAAGTLPKLPTAPVVRIGFFANVTHAPALVAQQLRLFETGAPSRR